jgi:hypothetical protein
LTFTDWEDAMIRTSVARPSIRSLVEAASVAAVPFQIPAGESRRRLGTSPVSFWPSESRRALGTHRPLRNWPRRPGLAGSPVR